MDFKTLYITWYSRLKNFAITYVNDEDDAEDIVEDIFLKIYERPTLLNDDVNIVSYLFVSVKHACQNHLREQLSFAMFKGKYQKEIQFKYDALSSLDIETCTEERLSEMLKQAIDKLPKRCREIFILNKLQGKPQKTIAEELGVSVNTIESQMAIAYKKLRQELQGVLMLYAFLCSM